MFKILAIYGIPTELICAIKKLYTASKAVVFVGGKQSDPFDITTGVLQGDVLAPFLFIVVIDYVMNKSAGTHGFVYKKRSSTRHPDQVINDLDFADDIVLLENSIEMANEQLRILNKEACKVGLTINEEKTEVMMFNIPDNEDVFLDGRKLKRVDDFKYLGAMMASTKNELKRREAQAWGAFASLKKIWSAAHLPLRLRADIFEAAVVSIFLYGCESWIVKPEMERHINSFGTTCYRQMLGIKRMDRVRNEEILKKVGKRPLMDAVRKRQMGWLGHTLRLNELEPARIFALYEPEHGTQKPGPRTLSYKKQITKLISAEAPDDINVQHIEELARDRKKWAKLTAAYGDNR